jgi:hypothetical protein
VDARHVDRINLMPLGIHLLEDVSSLKGDGLEGDVELEGEVAKGRVEREAGEHAALRKGEDWVS